MSYTVKQRIKRAWYALAPKLVAFLTAGLSATLVIQIADAFGFEMPTGIANLIVMAAGVIAGYIKTDTVPAEVTPGVDGGVVDLETGFDTK